MPILVLDAMFRRVEVASIEDVQRVVSASTANKRIVHIEVEGTNGVSGWTSDDVIHPDAPTTFFYADLDHGAAGLLTKNAFCTSGIAYTDFIFTNILYQQRVNEKILRIWIHKEPSYNMVFDIVG